MIGKKFPFEYEDILSYDRWGHAIIIADKEHEYDIIEIDRRADFDFIIRAWNRLGKLPTRCKRGYNDVSESEQNITAIENRVGRISGEEVITLSEELEARGFEISRMNLLMMKIEKIREKKFEQPF